MKKVKPSRESRRVKVYFEVASDRDGYPPVNSEFLWCIPTNRGTYIVDNIPFFVHEISLGDEISADKQQRRLKFVTVLHKSTNSTVRVLLKDEESTSRIRRKLDEFGCGTELMAELGLLTVSMPESARVAKALAFLDEEAEHDTVGIEESSVRYK